MDDILLNSGVLGGNGWKKSGGGSSDSGMFIFNGYNLSNLTTRRVIESDHDNLGTVAFETYNYPRSDGGNALSKYYRKKTITITLSLCATTEEGLNDLIDELKFQTSKTQGYLDIVINGTVRRREATLTSLNFGRKSYNVNRIGNVVLRFECINPLSFSLNTNTKTYAGISNDYATEIQYNGKVIVYPTIYVNISSASSLSSFAIDMNGYIYTINEEISAGDLIQIDGESKMTRINGVIVPYAGPFPAIEPGLNHVEIKLNSGATATYSMVFIYKDLYL